MPTVFISYSHDSPEHSARVLKFARALRGQGIDAELDQFHKDEIADWPRWCNEKTSREHADFFVCVCMAEYKRRIDGHVPPENAKGVYWEGSLLDDDLYDEKGNRRIIPTLLDDPLACCNHATSVTYFSIPASLSPEYPSRPLAGTDSAPLRAGGRGAIDAGLVPQWTVPRTTDEPHGRHRR